MTALVPNEFPTYSSGCKKIAIIGEAPGQEEVEQQKPFVGASGRLLMSLLNSSGISRGMYFLGNICQVRPPNNDITRFKWEGEEIQSGLKQLKEDLQKFQPNVILACGAYALRAIMGYKASIKHWRGSIFMGCSDFPYKVVAAYHPSACLRTYSWIPILNFDIKKAIRESDSPSLNLPKRTLEVDLKLDAILQRLDALKQSKELVAFDIEGYANEEGITCIGFSTRADYAFTIPFEGNVWTEAEELILWDKIAEILRDEKIPKIAQNGFYDCFVLAHIHGIVVSGLVDDTMLSHYELNCELEKSLEFQNSIYTREPYYKGERKAETLFERLKYNAKDCAITREIRDKTVPALAGEQKKHYEFNLSLSSGPLLYLSLRGIRYDSAASKSLEEPLHNERLASLEQCYEAAGNTFNPNSSLQLKSILYDKLKLPVQKKRARKGEENGRVTCDYEALISLFYETGHPILLNLIKFRELNTKIKILSATTDSDGRMRCSYNIVGTETGRISCSESPTGSGWNLQTIPKEYRAFYLPDQGYSMFEVDLAGADAWTVAAHSAALGDDTLLGDLLFGLKPQKLLTLALRQGDSIFGFSRDKLKEECKKGSFENSDWDYYASKKIVHGSNYMMMPPMLASQIFKESAKKLGIDKVVRVTTQQAKHMQDLYFKRYPGVLMYQDYIKQKILKDGYIISGNGHKRVFLGRRQDKETVREGCSHEPQMMTTWVTNNAMKYMYEQICNERHNTPQILHSIHDAILGQFNDKQAMEDVVYEAFNFPITVHGISLTIPYDLKTGLNWRDLK